MQSSSAVGGFAYYDVAPSSTDGAYLLTLPDGPAGHNRLGVDASTGLVVFTADSYSGVHVRFRITEAN